MLKQVVKITPGGSRSTVIVTVTVTVTVTVIHGNFVQTCLAARNDRRRPMFDSVGACHGDENSSMQHLPSPSVCGVVTMMSSLLKKLEHSMIATMTSSLSKKNTGDDQQIKSDPTTITSCCEKWRLYFSNEATIQKVTFWCTGKDWIYFLNEATIQKVTSWCTEKDWICFLNEATVTKSVVKDQIAFISLCMQL